MAERMKWRRGTFQTCNGAGVWTVMDGYVSDGPFAVHRILDSGWRLTHLPSGMFIRPDPHLEIIEFRTKAAAQAFAQRLVDTGVNWNFATRSLRSSRVRAAREAWRTVVAELGGPNG